MAEEKKKNAAPPKDKKEAAPPPAEEDDSQQRAQRRRVDRDTEASSSGEKKPARVKKVSRSSNVFANFTQAQIQELKEASKKAKEGGKDGKRAQRATSNVFAMFNQNQIQEFKEAFTMMDENRDGFIDSNDLRAMYSSLGREPKDSEIEGMLKEAPDPSKFNFTAFLTLFGEQLHGTDPENTLMMAFKMFDEDGKDYIDEAYVKELLTQMGDNFTESELKQTWKEAPVNEGKFDYKQMVKIMKRGADEDIQ